MAESSHNWDEAGSDGRQDRAGAECAAMKQIMRLLAGTVLIASCQRSAGSAAQGSQDYRDDIARLCDVVVQSGADQVPPGERALPIASWLGTHLQTQEAREYVARIQPLTGEPKAAALDAEARRVGLARRALAAAGRAAPRGPPGGGAAP